MKNIWWVIVAGGLFLSMIGACGDEEVTETVKEEPKQEVKAEEPKKEEEPEKAAPEDDSIDAQVALKVLQDNYEGIATVKYIEETDTFTVLPTDDGFALEMAQVMAGQLDKAVWNELVNTFAEVSEALGPKYLLVMLNPANPDNYVIMAGNGLVMYDALNEEGSDL